MTQLSPHELAYVASAHWSGEDLKIAVAIALAESGGHTDALARSTTGDNLGQRDHGPWQISGRWHGPKLAANPNWRDPVVNAKIAKQVFDETVRMGKVGWEAWSVFNSGTYKTFLPDAEHGVKALVAPPAADAPNGLTLLAIQEAAAAGIRQVLGQLDRP